jgi:hypothetical protein
MIAFSTSGINRFYLKPNLEQSVSTTTFTGSRARAILCIGEPYPELTKQFNDAEADNIKYRQGNDKYCSRRFDTDIFNDRDKQKTTHQATD